MEVFFEFDEVIIGHSQENGPEAFISPESNGATAGVGIIVPIDTLDSEISVFGANSWVNIGWVGNGIFRAGLKGKDVIELFIGIKPILDKVVYAVVEGSAIAIRV